MINLKHELPDGSYSVSDIQDYFQYILKRHGKMTDTPPTRIYVNEIKIVLSLRKRQDIISNF